MRRNSRRAADGIYAAVRAKYPDEATFDEKLEPYADKLRSRNRDGLVDYLLSAPDGHGTVWRQRFGDANDLYHYFLTDVMVEGCARTSSVVAAIVGPAVRATCPHEPRAEPREPADCACSSEDPRRLQPEWAWRKNYRVWEANRKVFLYPENYIEPGLRDDKTPLFKTLEEVLLQQPITEQNSFDAYAEYLRGFDEVARLRVAGAYHDRSDPGSDVLHLFGVSASDPPVYYYRTISSLQPVATAASKRSRPVFSPWTKLDLQIPARRVSPVVVNGRLYIFWVETTTRHKTEFIEGSSTFTGYRHSVRTKFAYLRLDGRWTPPQVLKIADDAGDFADTRLIDDYVMKDEYLFDFFDNRGRLVKTFDVRTSTDPLGDLGKLARQYPDGSYEAVRWAQWDTFSRHHTAPLETYVPGGWQWERTYPAVVGSGDAARIALEFAPRTDKASPTPELVDLWSAQATAGSTDAAAAAGYLVVEALPDSGGQLLLEVLRFLPGGVPFFEATWWLNEKEWTSQDQALFPGSGPSYGSRRAASFRSSTATSTASSSSHLASRCSCWPTPAHHSSSCGTWAPRSRTR